MYTKAAQVIPNAHIYTGPYSASLDTIAATAVQQVGLGKATPAEALKAAADQMRTETGMK
jgi:hypothetical protein